MDLLEAAVRALDEDLEVSVGIPRDLRLLGLVREDGGLAAEERDERVAGDRDLRHPLEVAGLRRAVEELLVLDVEELELTAVRREQEQRRPERAPTTSKRTRSGFCARM